MAVSLSTAENVSPLDLFTSTLRKLAMHLIKYVPVCIPVDTTLYPTPQVSVCVCVPVTTTPTPPPGCVDTSVIAVCMYAPCRSGLRPWPAYK